MYSTLFLVSHDSIVWLSLEEFYSVVCFITHQRNIMIELLHILVIQ
jgi:hypothetical protein